MADDDATQMTQNVIDPRRMGLTNSGLNSDDLADVICILHPCSPAAYKIVARTALRAPQHVLQTVHSDESDIAVRSAALEEQETFVLERPEESRQALDLALRFTSWTHNTALGFLFGRNTEQCDIVLDCDTVRRVSNMHFRIFINPQGVCMLQDLSTNGTMVDDMVLQGKRYKAPQTRMLNAGSIIQILSPKFAEEIKFIVRIPQRENCVVEYRERFQSYMQAVAAAESANQVARNRMARPAVGQPQQPQHAQHQATQAVRAASSVASVTQPFLPSSQWGMKWNGGSVYNVVGHLGQGAFATVYKLATKAGGQLYAAKELEKRRFMKNGILDRKLDNEMQIMKTINHPSVVQYVDYHDHDKHLYIIMEYINCGDLQQYLSSHGPLPEQTGKVMARQVFEALVYLHHKKITHRDIKPDNILIANDSPNDFLVKLSDFGLSKVVKDNDTFLKTFCGTLLYCAPEVFPHYDSHLASKGKKRNRIGGVPQQAKFHSYSQSVDVWSFGAVLWYSLCGRPPFEGVPDSTGRGMFERIMATSPDPTPLRRANISESCIDLLLQMLNTDPSLRPIPAECLRHIWFADLGITQVASPAADGLDPIEEEEEAQELEPDLSQLNIQGDFMDEEEDEVDFDSSEFELLDPRMSKRIRFRGSSERDSQSQPSRKAIGSSGVGVVAADRPAQGRLFGEIGASQLVHPGAGLYPSLPPQDQTTGGTSMPSFFDQGSTRPQTSLSGNADSHSRDLYASSGQPRPDSFTTGGALSEVNLMGAESLVRDLNMDSPESGNSRSAEEAPSPATPDEALHSSPGDDFAEQTPTKALDNTPKQPVFSRQIELPVTASFFYDPSDPSTHNIDYASLRSGHDFRSAPTISAADFAAKSRHLADLKPPQLQTPPQTIPQPTLQPAVEFARPPPRVGRLVSTPDSFADITIPLTSQNTSWGRGTKCTVQWPDRNDERIPRRGIMLMMSAPSLRSSHASEQDWIKMPDLYCDIATESSLGIWINGIHLLEQDKKKRKLFGRVHTGDVVTVLNPRTKNDGRKDGGLSFVCEFFHGEARVPRKEGEKAFVVQAKYEKRDSGASL